MAFSTTHDRRRSADDLSRTLAFVALKRITEKPFNIASYPLLPVMLGHVTGYEPGEFVHTIGDAHIYSNHLHQVDTQLARDPRPLPTLRLAREVPSIFDFRFEDFECAGCDPVPAIKATVAV